VTAAHQAPQSTTKKPVSHIGALDGLRGLAVLFVLIFHFSWSFPDRTPLLAAIRAHLWGGWFGVDLFFALSGYLITRGLVKPSTHSVGKRLKLFWARRIFRIFPLYYIVIILGTLVCLAIGARSHIPGLSYWLYYQNYALAFDAEPLRWTAHFWSLAIEEQFYFVWPVFVLMAGKRLRIGAAIGLFGFCVVLRTGLMLGLSKLNLAGWDAYQIAKVIYRATPTHMDGLLLGALLAMLDEDRTHWLSVGFRKIRAWLTIGSGVLLLGLVVWTKGFSNEDRRVMILGFPILALFFTSAISLAVDGKVPPSIGRLLSRGLLASFGKVSYGMYIFHWIFVSLLAERQRQLCDGFSTPIAVAFSAGVIVAGILVSYLLALVSFRFIESKFLMLKEKFHE
jgi:peptidoglycan/LPS O-acetylase OafA/YrhL